MLEEIQEPAEVTTPDKIKKKWRAKVESKTLDPTDLISYFQLSASYFLTVSKKDNASDIGESFVINLCNGSRENLENLRLSLNLDKEKVRSCISISLSTLHFAFCFECALFEVSILSHHPCITLAKISFIDSVAFDPAIVS